MDSFKIFIEQQEFVDYIIESFDKGQSWSAGKDEIIQSWKQIQPDTPIYITPIDTDHQSKSIEKSSYGEDGVRITGSWAFIASIIGRLKDLLQFENPKTKLRLAFKGVEGRADKQSFAFYINLETRRPKKPRAKKFTGF